MEKINDRSLRALAGIAGAGVGVMAGVGTAAWMALQHQATVAGRIIEAAAIEAARDEGQLPDGGTGAFAVRPPDGDGVYGRIGGRRGSAADGVLRLAMLGDSTAVGYGVRTRDELPGVLIARGLASEFGCPVRLTSHGVIGSGAADLSVQVRAVLDEPPSLVVLLTGGNDVRNTVPPQRAADQLGAAVTSLRAAGALVVVGTCPDFSVITAIPQPLRTLIGAWSRRLAALQERAVLQAGGRAVAIGRLVSPGFVGRPDLFSSDLFHPSGAGYARAAAVLLPAAIEVVREQGRLAEESRADLSQRA